MAFCYNCGKEYTPNIDKFCANCIGFAMFILHGAIQDVGEPLQIAYGGYCIGGAFFLAAISG